MRIGARVTGLMAAVLLVLGISLAGAPAASAHPYVNGCQGTHTSAGYRNTVLSQEVYKTIGSATFTVNTRWHVYNYITKEIHFHNTHRACFRPGLGF